MGCITAWHATPSGNVETIVKRGFRPSKTGRLGPGVYFTNRLSHAISIAKNARGGKGKRSVLTVKIFTKRKMFNAHGNSYPGSRWRFRAGIAKGKHPPWGGIQTPFTEFVVRNAKNIKVIKVG